MVELQNLSFAYAGQPVFTDLSMTFPDTGVVCLFGPSGCGKTTLLRLLAGLEKPQQGQIVGLEGKRIAMVFQDNRLLPWKTALDNIAVTLPDAPEVARQKAAAALAAVGLQEAAEKYPAACSGGMQRRIAIARAMVAEPDVLLLDEPFAGLDAERRDDIARQLTERRDRQLIVLVTHDREEAQLMGAEILYLQQE